MQTHEAKTVLLGSLILFGLFSIDTAENANLSSAPQSTDKFSIPLTPSQAIGSFRVEDGLRVELAACEPATIDPVAVAFDEQGRMFVVEDRGYPTGPGPDQPPAGIIALLEDTDGDGLYDKRTVFAEGLTFPNGIVCWRGGLFVTCAPDIYYLKDTNGSGKADVRRVVLTGFDDTTTTQLRVSHPTLGLDGWIYLTSGLTGGKVRSPEHPERPPLEFKKSDSRFKPDTLEFETVAGAGQFGLSFDEFGRKFVCSNRNPLQHIVLEPRYLARNPYLAFSETVQDVASFGDAGKVWPISPDTTTASFIPELMGSPHAGTFTSACGCLIYRGELLGPDCYGNAFICEPAQNLVQRQVLSPNGATFRSRPAHEGADFLTSPDTWFRPVFAAEGPEDALYICDMYRKVIDHPQYLPESVRVRSDFDAGKDKGRIYRIVPNKSSAQELVAARKPRLHRAAASELCAGLNHPNGWVRATAFRLLLERKDKSAVPLLNSLAKDARSLPQTRLAALRLLHNFGSLQLETLQAGLKDTHAGVREQAIKLAQARLSDSQELFEPVRHLGDDPDPGVRFQCALALGEAAVASNVKVLARIAGRDGGDRWSRAAVLSSIHQQEEDFFKAFVAVPSATPEAMAAVMIDLSRIFGLSLAPEKCLALFNELTKNTKGSEATWQAAAVVGMAEGLRSRGLSKPGIPVLRSLVSVDSSEGRKAQLGLKELIDQARKTACDDDAPISRRLSAIALIGEAGEDDSGAILLSLITPKEPTEVQVGAVRACGQSEDQELQKALVTRERWRGYLASVREAVLATLISERRYLPILFDALERGDIQTWSLEPARRNQLMQNKDEALRARAVALFKHEGSEDRQKVYNEYKSVLSLPAIAKNGHDVFKRVCTQCHTHHGEGVAVGPDLTGLHNQPAEALLLHILIPSYEIVPGYTSYDVETKDGRILSGLIASESATTITLKRSMGVMDSILRNNIASISSTGLSLMPDELEKTMTRQELADLIAFLKDQDSIH